MRGTYSSRFEQALVYTYQLHARQTRKGGDIPYMSHLMSVCALVMENGGAEDQAIAALLHDAIEDQGGRPTAEAIERHFGPNVRRLVEGCTDADEIPKPPWRKRKERYLAHLREAPADVRLVSICDKLHNARTILTDLRESGPRVWSRFSAGADESLWYYRSLLDTFRVTATVPRLVEELQSVLDAIDAEVARACTG